MIYSALWTACFFFSMQPYEFWKVVHWIWENVLNGWGWIHLYISVVIVRMQHWLFDHISHRCVHLFWKRYSTDTFKHGLLLWWTVFWSSFHPSLKPGTWLHNNERHIGTRVLRRVLWLRGHMYVITDCKTGRYAFDHRRRLTHQSYSTTPKKRKEITSGLVTSSWLRRPRPQDTRQPARSIMLNKKLMKININIFLEVWHTLL